jgi:hypothetical protein
MHMPVIHLTAFSDDSPCRIAVITVKSVHRAAIIPLISITDMKRGLFIGVVAGEMGCLSG